MLEISLDLFKKALEASEDGFFLFDKDLRVIYANSKALELAGLEGDEAIGKTWLELADGGFFHGNAAVEARRTRERRVAEFVNQIGCHQLCTATPLLDAQGKVDFVVTNVRDVTRLHELQIITAENQAEIQKLRKTLKELRSEKKLQLIFASESMRKLVSAIDRIAPTDISVLLLGETGVGKSIVAERIHEKSSRAEGKLIIVNCGAIPATLCESEFFGHEKGAFTGALSTKIGIFEAAHQGTLFLDEIGELPLEMQVKLLRVLQTGCVKRIGSHKEISVNVRLITATNRDLRTSIRNGEFREDLYYRIKSMQFTVPPLRERRGDIKKMLQYFLNYFCNKYGVKKKFSEDVIDKLQKYDWPGNVRELSHLVENMVILSENDIIDCKDLPDDITKTQIPIDVSIIPMKTAVADVEKKLLVAAINKYGNTRDIGKALEISHATVARKIKEYGLGKEK